MKRLGLYVPWALFVIVCVGWTIYWFGAKDAAVKALDAAVTRAAGDGIEAGYGGVRASGYPLRLTLTLTDAYVALPTPRVRIDAPTLPVSINLSNPRHVMIGLAEGLRWESEDRVVHRMSADSGQMSVRVDGGGGLARVSLDLEKARVTHTNGDPTAIGKLLLHVRPDVRRAADAQLVVDATDWAGPTPFAALNAAGPFAHFRAAAVVTDYASLATKTPLGSWTGALRIERLDVGYAGTAVTGAGDLDLDAEYRAAGALRLTPAGGAPVELRAGDGWWTFAGLRVAPAKPLYVPPPD